MQPDKENCARIAVRNEFDILYSFTLECSYAGTMRGKFRNNHFTIPHLRKLGADFCCALFTLTSDKKAVEGAIKELREMYPSINHLLNEDEGKFKELASAEKEKIMKLIHDGKLSHKDNEILPFKQSKMSNARTVYEGERNQLKKGFFSKIFGCSS